MYLLIKSKQIAPIINHMATTCSNCRCPALWLQRFLYVLLLQCPCVVLNHVPCMRSWNVGKYFQEPFIWLTFIKQQCEDMVYVSSAWKLFLFILDRVFLTNQCYVALHDDVIKWKHFPRYWPFVRGIHRSPVNSPHKGQWRGALMFTLICARINGWVNNREAGDLRRYRAHYDVIVMEQTHGLHWGEIVVCRCYSY